MDWYGIKVSVTDVSGLSRDALHILAGVAGQLLCAALLRVRISHPLPWAAVLAAVLANEYYDLGHELWPDRALQWSESAKDLVSTMALPTLLLVLARWAPGLFTERHTPVPVPPDPRPSDDGTVDTLSDES